VARAPDCGGDQQRNGEADDGADLGSHGRWFTLVEPGRRDDKGGMERQDHQGFRAALTGCNACPPAG